MGYKIVLTCDRTLASDYHGLLFFGFVASLPKRVPPDWLYYPLFSPKGKADSSGRLLFASSGLRKIEASLLNNGFSREDVIVAHPDYLHKVIDKDTEIVAISCIDPLGIGPVTNTFRELWGDEGRMVIKLRELLNHKLIKKNKPTIVLGGPGAWQLSVYPEKLQELGIDFVVTGEGDVTAPKLFNQILNNGKEQISKHVVGENADDNTIYDVVGASPLGLVEATRGCARSCAFCAPSLKKVRSRPVENILREVDVNIKSGNTGVLLHGEDILLYKSDGLKVNSEGVVDLFEQVKNAPGVKWLAGVHTAFSSVVSSPQTIERISKVLELGTQKHPVSYLQVGIETGSAKLINQHMKGKIYPFEPDDWPEVVRKGMKILHDNNFGVSSTLILGLPGEEEEDVQKTIDLVKSLKPYRSFIVPLLFSPMESTRLEYSKPLLKENLTAKHYELFVVCWEHNFYWIPILWEYYGRKVNSLGKILSRLAFKAGIFYVRRRLYRNALKHGAIL